VTARTDRIDELLREEIGGILARDVRDPRIGFVTITDVETAPDLSIARVWVSVIGQPAEREQTIRALQRAMPFVRHELGSKIRLRRIPELQIRADDTSQRGTRVLELLAELEAGGNPVHAAPPAESLPTPVPRLGLPEERSNESRPRGKARKGGANVRRGRGADPGRSRRGGPR
jgi:ribosome-binding factor A